MIHPLLNQLATPYTGEDLFDQLADIVYFIKDEAARYAVVNRTLVDRSGARDKCALLGKTAGQALCAPLGEQFEAQDRLVLRTGQPILSRLELHAYPSRDTGWCLTTKMPLRGKSRGVVGLVGVSQDLRTPDYSSDAYRQLAEVLSETAEQLTTTASVEEMATRAGLSRFQFDRRMQSVFGITTRQWLVKLRVGAAERLLRDTDEPIASVAHAVGYADQSAFTRQFSKTTGFAPRAYRQAYAVGSA